MKNEILVHALKAVKFRFQKAVEKTADTLGAFKAGEQTRTPIEIIQHMSDLMNKTTSILTKGHMKTEPLEMLTFEAEVSRFLQKVDELVQLLESMEISLDAQKKILQGPLIDCATHVGQIAMLNGLNGNQVKKVSYFNVDV